MNKLEIELIKLNEQKFGTLEGPTGTNGHDDLGAAGVPGVEGINDSGVRGVPGVEGIRINEQIEEGDNNSNSMNTQEIEELTWKKKYFPDKKVLNYLKRDA